MNSDISFVKLDTSGMDLATLKAYRYGEIDFKTGSLIAPGFVYDSNTFSLSPNAQLNWSELHSNPTDFIWPKDVSTTDNNTYSLAETNLNAFWTAGKDVVDGHLGSGRALKKQVFDAVDIDAVNAVVDNR